MRRQKNNIERRYKPDYRVWPIKANDADSYEGGVPGKLHHRQDARSPRKTLPSTKLNTPVQWDWYFAMRKEWEEPTDDST